MEKIDWDKPLVLMNDAPCFAASPNPDGSRCIASGPDGFFVCIVDDYGCIGGVQVVRNRKEPEKRKIEIHLAVYDFGGQLGASAYANRPTALLNLRGKKQIACLHIVREFVEGEGLEQ